MSFDVGDIVYVPYSCDVPAGFYEVSCADPLWIKDDEKGSFNSQHYNFGHIKLIAKNTDRKDVDQSHEAANCMTYKGEGRVWDYIGEYSFDCPNCSE